MAAIAAMMGDQTVIPLKKTDGQILAVRDHLVFLDPVSGLFIYAEFGFVEEIPV